MSINISVRVELYDAESSELLGVARHDGVTATVMPRAGEKIPIVPGFGGITRSDVMRVSSVEHYLVFGPAEDDGPTATIVVVLETGRDSAQATLGDSAHVKELEGDGWTVMPFGEYGKRRGRQQH